MGDKSRQPSSDIMMSWADMWLYFKSNRCTDEMRAFTWKYLYLVDCLDGASTAVQNEILEFAPDYIKSLPEIQAVLNRQTITNTLSTKTATLNVPMSLLIALAKRNA